MKQRKILSWHNSTSVIVVPDLQWRVEGGVASFTGHQRDLDKLESLFIGVDVYLGTSYLEGTEN